MQPTAPPAFRISRSSQPTDFRTPQPEPAAPPLPASRTPDPPPSLLSTSSPSTQHRSLRRTPRFEESPSPEPRRIHLEAASLGFNPQARFATAAPPSPSPPPPEPLPEPETAAEDDAPSQRSQPRSVEPSQDRRSRRRREAVVLSLESLRAPNLFSPDLIEEYAPNPFGLGYFNARPATATPPMSDSGLMAGPSGAGSSRPGRGQPAGGSQSSAARFGSPHDVLDHRRKKIEKVHEDRMRREQEQQDRLEQAEARRLDEQRLAQEAKAAEQARLAAEQRRRERTEATAGPSMPTMAGQSSMPMGGAKTRTNFPHAFERWETLSSHWESLTTFWVQKMEANKDEIDRDPISKQLRRQVTDLSAAGANLFHAVVELQRLRASSERKFTRWFFETRSELEKLQDGKARAEMALQRIQTEPPVQHNEVDEDKIREEVSMQFAVQMAELKKELGISKEEARRAWEELGRKEQAERDRTISLQSGRPTIVGGIQVVPMTQGMPSRHRPSREPAYAQSPGYPEYTQAPPVQPTPTSAGPSHQYADPALQPQRSYGSAASEEAYSEGEHLADAGGNFAPDAQGNRIPHQSSSPGAADSDSDVSAEDFETPATHVTAAGSMAYAAPAASHQQAAGEHWQQPQQPQQQQQEPPLGAYEPQRHDEYETPDNLRTTWDNIPAHHRPTRLSDVIEEDERSRTSAGAMSRGER